MKSLTENQLSFLMCLREHAHGGVNWAGTDPKMRAQMTKRGFCEHKSEYPTRDGVERHTQHSHYRLTALGADVVMGAAFDKGLALGFSWWVEWAELKEAEDAKLREEQMMKRFGTDERSMVQVRSFIMARVRKEES